MNKARTIQAAVARAWDLSIEEVRGRTRIPYVDGARVAAYWIARHATGMSYPQIGRQFGRDHTTILSGVRRADALRRSDQDFAENLFDALADVRDDLDRTRCSGNVDAR